MANHKVCAEDPSRQELAARGLGSSLASARAGLHASLAPAGEIGCRVVNMRDSLRLFRYICKEGYCYVRWRLGNAAKSLLPGRKPIDDARLAFFGQYILHLACLKRIKGITCRLSEYDASTEGAGCQALQMMRTMAFARAFGVRFLHTPFELIAHADRPMHEWVAAWESLFNLGAGEIPCKAEARGVMNLTFYVEEFHACLGNPKRIERLNDSFKAMLPEFQRKYYFNKSPRTAKVLTVAAHIRRNDVSTQEYSYMYTSTAKILEVANAVKSILNAHGVPLSLRFYGQGNIEDFPELSGMDAEFFFNTDPIWTMQELVEIDVLIVAKSYFSIYAGLISDGIKIFEPEPGRWPHLTNLDAWLPCRDDGSIDQAAFERALFPLLQARQDPAIREAGVSGANASIQ
jgi:hypothetical protein